MCIFSDTLVYESWKLPNEVFIGYSDTVETAKSVRHDFAIRYSPIPAKKKRRNRATDLELRRRGLAGEQLLECRVPVAVLGRGDRGGGGPGRARRAGIAAGRVGRVGPRGRAARARALVAPGRAVRRVVVLRVAAQAARVAVRLAAALGLALVRLFVAVRQHVTVPGSRRAIGC